MEEHNAHTTSDLTEKAQNTKQQFKAEIAQMIDAIESNRQQRHRVILNYLKLPLKYTISFTEYRL